MGILIILKNTASNIVKWIWSGCICASASLLRLFVFPAFSQALLNEVCRAHPGSLWCCCISFFLSTRQSSLALPHLAVAETEKIHQNRPANIWKFGECASRDLVSSHPLAKAADRLMWNNPITLARRDRAPWAEVCYYWCVTLFITAHTCLMHT